MAKKLPRFETYKNSGAIQLSLIPAQDTAEDAYTLIKGYLIVEMAPSTGQKNNFGNLIYDWGKKKITMKLNEVDIQILMNTLLGTTPKSSVIHDPSKANADAGKNKKFLNIEKAPQNGYYLGMAYNGDTVKCSLSDEEARTIRILLNKAIPSIFGW